MDGLKRFNEIIQYFKDQGYDEEQLTEVYDAIGKAAYDKFVKDTMEHLSEEDMDEISKLQDDDEIADEVRKRYEKYLFVMNNNCIYCKTPIKIDCTFIMKLEIIH